MSQFSKRPILSNLRKQVLVNINQSRQRVENMRINKDSMATGIATITEKEEQNESLRKP